MMNISSVPVGDRLFGKINCKATGRALLTLLLSRDFLIAGGVKRSAQTKIE